MFVIWRPWAAYISPYYHVVRPGCFSLHKTRCQCALDRGRNARLACLCATVGATLANTSAHPVCADQRVGPERLLPHAHRVRGQGRNFCELEGQGPRTARIGVGCRKLTSSLSQADPLIPLTCGS